MRRGDAADLPRRRVRGRGSSAETSFRDADPSEETSPRQRWRDRTHAAGTRISSTARFRSTVASCETRIWRSSKIDAQRRSRRPGRRPRAPGISGAKRPRSRAGASNSYRRRNPSSWRRRPRRKRGDGARTSRGSNRSRPAASRPPPRTTISLPSGRPTRRRRTARPAGRPFRC